MSAVSEQNKLQIQTIFVACVENVFEIVCQNYRTKIICRYLYQHESLRPFFHIRLR